MIQRIVSRYFFEHIYFIKSFCFSTNQGRIEPTLSKVDKIETVGMIIDSIPDPCLGIKSSHDPTQLFVLSRIYVHNLISGKCVPRQFHITILVLVSIDFMLTSVYIHTFHITILLLVSIDFMLTSIYIYTFFYFIIKICSCRYIHELCVERKLQNKYCILDPTHIGLTRGSIRKNILIFLKDKLKGNIKDCYLAPFYRK